MSKRPSNHGGIDQHPQVWTNPARTQGEVPELTGDHWRFLAGKIRKIMELNGGLLGIVFVGSRSDMPDKQPTGDPGVGLS